MPLVLIDVLPSRQAIVNTDHIVRAHVVDEKMTIFLIDGGTIQTPHDSAVALFEDLGDMVPIL